MSQAAGWYADPTNADQLKYWDGNAWTEHTSPATATAPQAEAAPAYAQQAAYAPPQPGYAPQPAYGAPQVYAPAFVAVPGAGLPAAIAGRALASYGQRVGAYLIDFLFLCTIVGIIIDPILMGRDGEKNGMSLGKQLVGIRVVREDGAPVTVGFAFLRELVVRWFLIGVVGGFFALVPLLDVLFPLWDKPGQQSLHDKIVSSYVVVA
jgi:uncharacterized RDD family membrane protein YckC